MSAPGPYPDEGVVLVDIAERIATVTLNRPDARNALDAELSAAIPRVLRALDTDPDVDVMILTGADPAFCAGVDLKALASGGRGLVLPKDTYRGPFPPRTKPLVGAVNGVAVTGGFELALGCDFLVASEHARFADTHARVGVMPGWGLTILLPQAIGVRRAREMSVTGNFIDAATALAWGLVNHVVPHDALLPTARALAADIAGNDQQGVRRMLATYDEGALVTGLEAWAIEHRVALEWAARDDHVDFEARRAAVTARGRAQQGQHQQQQ